MEGENNSNTVQQMAAVVAEPQVWPVSEAAEVAVVSAEQMNHVEGGNGHGEVPVSASGGEGELGAKRKRGRPRKQPGVEARQEFMAMPESLASPQKRGRGRPKGSGKWQILTAYSGGSATDSAGSKFSPHIIRIQTGENIVQRICSFSRKASESICILSASGTISSAEILRSASFGGIIRYEGQFEIVSLSGSYLNNGMDGARAKTCLLSVQLANPHGALFGGAVAGWLIAGGPTQVVIATFRQKSKEQAKMRKPDKSTVAVPLQTANSELTEAEVNGRATVSHVSAPPVEGVDKVMNGHDENHASPQPFDWSSLPAPTSQHVMISDFLST